MASLASIDKGVRIAKLAANVEKRRGGGDNETESDFQNVRDRPRKDEEEQKRKTRIMRRGRESMKTIVRKSELLLCKVVVQPACQPQPPASGLHTITYHSYIQTDRQTDRRHYTLPPALPLSQLSLLPTRCEARAETAKTVILFAPLPLFNHRVMRGPKHRREQADQRNFTPHESEWPRPAGPPTDEVHAPLADVADYETRERHE